MAASYKQRLLSLQREYERRLDADLGELGKQIGRLVQAAAITSPTGERIVPNLRRVKERLRQNIWSQIVKPYFIGAADEAITPSPSLSSDGKGERVNPQSPFARLLMEGIQGAVRIEAERQISIVKKYADERVWEWLTRPGRVAEMGIRGQIAGKLILAEQKFTYDPFHMFVYGNSPYKLSDRVWNTAIDVRARIDALLDYEIPQGTAAVKIADLLVPFLNPSERGIVTSKPYGQVGSYSARRLARTEITAAAGRSVIAASAANPWVSGVDWALSAGHPRIDICDQIATIGMGGGRIREPYPVGSVPPYPAHPHELCTLIPAVTATPAEVTRQLRTEIEDSAENAVSLRGVFNLEWLVLALMYGWLGSVVEGLGQ